MPRIVPNLWFDTAALKAANFYVSVFPDSSINTTAYYGEEGLREPGSVMLVDFTLDGQRFTAINGGPQFHFDDAVSFLIECADQAEVDYYWERLTEGGEESMCGWLKDRFGLSWQVVPTVLNELMDDPDAAKSLRVRQAMLGMRKLDIAALQAAADGA